jgi:hypothetical protein
MTTAPERRSPRGITAEAGEPYLGHTPTNLARPSRLSSQECSQLRPPHGSPKRLAPYLEETGGEHDKALALYVWNARISAAAFEALHHVEVILRTRGRVVVGLSFGFWRALFDKKYAGLWVSHLHQAFPAGSGERAEVATLMSNLVPFRNRLAHHETIVMRPISTHYEEMLALVGLIDPEARAWVEEISRVNEVLNARRRARLGAAMREERL